MKLSKHRRFLWEETLSKVTQYVLMSLRVCDLAWPEGMGLKIRAGSRWSVFQADPMRATQSATTGEFVISAMICTWFGLLHGIVTVSEFNNILTNNVQKVVGHSDIWFTTKSNTVGTAVYYSATQSLDWKAPNVEQASECAKWLYLECGYIRGYAGYSWCSKMYTCFFQWLIIHFSHIFII